jgi:hypothetical protein
MDLNAALKYVELKIDTTPPDAVPVGQRPVTPTKPGGLRPKRTEQPPLPSLAKVTEPEGVEWNPSLEPPQAAESDPFWQRPTPPAKPPLRITIKPPQKDKDPSQAPDSFQRALSEYKKQPLTPSQSVPPFLPKSPTAAASTEQRKGRVDQPFRLRFRPEVANRLNSLAGELADRHHQEVASQLGVTADTAKFLIGKSIRNNLKLALLLHKKPDRQLNDYSYTLRKGDKNATIEGTYS